MIDEIKLKELLQEVKEVIEFHVGSSHSDSSDWENEVLERVDSFINKLENAQADTT